MNPLESDPPLSPPPFDWYEDSAFAEDMTTLVPDERVRDDIVNDIGWQITHTLVGTKKSEGIYVLTGTEHSLIVTQTTPICPPLRVIYSVQDEPPKRRWINLRRAAFSSQVAGWGF